MKFGQRLVVVECVGRQFAAGHAGTKYMYAD